MQYQEFIKHVQGMAQIATPEETEAAIKATFETLAQRIVGNEASQLADQLPEEIGKYFRGHEGENGEHFTLQEFYSRVSEKEHVDPPTAATHVRAVMAVVNQAVTPSEFADIRASLSDDYQELFAAQNI